jgi:hypothetical protein
MTLSLKLSVYKSRVVTHLEGEECSIRTAVYYKLLTVITTRRPGRKWEFLASAMIINSGSINSRLCVIKSVSLLHFGDEDKTFVA